MARDPWKWMEAANRNLVNLRAPTPMPDGGLPEFQLDGLKTAFKSFSETGQMPKAPDGTVGDYFELLFLVRVLRQAVALSWKKLAARGIAYEYLVRFEEFHREALIHESAWKFVVSELYALHANGMLSNDALAFALSRQVSYLLGISRLLSGEAAEFIDSLSPGKRGRKAKPLFDPNNWIPASDKPIDQKDFMAWAAAMISDSGKVPLGTAIAQVIETLNSHGEIGHDVDIASLNRSIRRHLGKP